MNAEERLTSALPGRYAIEREIGSGGWSILWEIGALDQPDARLRFAWSVKSEPCSATLVHRIGCWRL
ncbi:MAG: hypothetical protein PVJ76_04425 [Gemmatimonadota bacterium]|jgi:hypothetical protein